GTISQKRGDGIGAFFVDNGRAIHQQSDGTYLHSFSFNGTFLVGALPSVIKLTAISNAGTFQIASVTFDVIKMF
ncbi:MAG: hypothetical protein AAFY41_08940, partial [Bacteroidota bacterium]